jgi:hypothetical protein
MANDGIIKGKDVIADDAITRIGTFNSGIEESVRLYGELIKEIAKLNTVAGGNKVMIERVKIDKDTNLQLKERDRLLKAVSVAEERRKQSSSELSKNLAKERFETQKINRENKQSAIINSDLADSYDKLGQRLAIAKRNLKNLTIEQGASAEATQKARAEFEKLNTQVRAADNVAGDFQRNVGNYPTKFAPAISAVRSLIGAFGIIEGIRLGASIVKDAILLSREAKGVTFAFKQLGEVGVDALERTRASTRGLVSDLDIKKAANEFQNFNLSVSQLPTLLEFVAVRAAQTGKSFEGLRDSLVEGLAKESTLRIDNLGISLKDLNAELKITGNFAQAVANIAKREIAEAGDIIDKTANATQRWNVATENTSLAIGDVFTKIKGSDFAVRTIENFAQGWKNLNFAIENNLSLKEAIQLNFRNLSEEGRKVNKTIIEEAEARNKNTEAINAQAAAYVKLNGSLAPLLKGQNTGKDPFSLFKEEDLRLVADINNELEKYNSKLQEGAFSTREEAKAIQDKISELEKERDAILGSEKARDNHNQALKGTIDFYSQLIKKQEGLRDETAKTPEEYKKLQREIDITKSKIEALQGVFDEVDFVYKPQPGDLEEIQGIYDALEAETKDLDLAFDVDQFLNTEGIQIGMKALAAKLGVNLEELNKEFTSLYEEDYKSFLKYAKLKEEVDQIAKDQQVDNLFSSLDLGETLAASFFELDTKRIDERQQRNEDAYNVIANSATSTEEQKDAAAKKYDQEQKKLEKEKADRQKKLFLIQQVIELGRIYIQAAVASAAALAPPPIGLGPALGAALIPGIQTNAGIAAGIVLAQAIPQFFKGKNAMDSYEGIGTWGERGREVNVDAFGNTEVSPNKTTPRYINKSDIIVPSISQFQQQLKDPSSDVFKRVSRKIGSDTTERNNMIVVSSPAIDTSGLKDEIKNGFRNIKIVNNNKNVYQPPRRTSY